MSALIYQPVCDTCGPLSKFDTNDEAMSHGERHYVVSGHDTRVETVEPEPDPEVTLWQDKYREADRAYIEANRKHHESLEEIHRLRRAIDAVIAEMVGMERAGASLVGREWVVRRLNQALSGEKSNA